MGFRYRRSINLGSGVRLNVSKRGISSVSVGRPGSTLNFGRRGVRATVGLPGTGLSYTTSSRGGDAGALALIGLVGTAFGLLFWVLGAAARGSRAAQVAIAGIAAFTLFACLHTPESGQPRPAPTLAATPASSPVDPAPTVILSSIPEPPAVLASANIAALMKTSTGANLRSGPSAQTRAVEQLPAGALVEVVGGEGRWAKVKKAGGGATGWVAWSLLTSPDASTPAKPMTAERHPRSLASAFDPSDIRSILDATPTAR